ncbi:heavy-metal-associated domain-containing protein [Pedobacter sp.]|uniref:heavy-metal-associated domain-containing protein n=1 Tax=Pedobacter sp. TaxID=1411316 RepID=UPI003D7F60DF
MKTILNLFIFLLFAGTASAQQITTVDLQVTGLTCSMCSKATEKSLRTLDFITDVKPDLNKNLFVLSFKKGQPVNLDLIKKKVEDAGFSVGALEATFDFSQLKVDDKGIASSGNVAYRFLNTKNKVLNGPVKATVLDKNFVSQAAFKKNAAKFNTPTYASGKGMVNGKNTRIYHLSI